LSKYKRSHDFEENYIISATS